MLLARKSQDFIPTLFNDLFDMNWNNFPISTAPQMNIKEDDKAYEMELSIPGMSKDDLSISIDQDNNLIVEINKKEKKDDKNSRYLRHEFTSSQFKEMMKLPDNICKDDINAKVENGILNITLPKKSVEEIKQATKQIAIH
ncbi:MAG: Hsp20/alpha crystallin family protein [Bacteroidales bacterium]|jgi:HSP20 family protein|nr:Hsp20/alpha crystallin family protein [Bacteroidales bacterium]